MSFLGRRLAAGGERHAKHGIARLDQRQHHRLIGLAAGMGLDIGEGAVEQALGAVDGELLDHVDILAAAVIAPAGIALGVFIGEERAGCVEHGLGDGVLRSDQFDFMVLTLVFVFDRVPDLGIGIFEMPGEEGAGARIGASRITCRHRHCSSRLRCPDSRSKTVP